MTTKLSQFNNGGAIIAGDQVVGLRGGLDYRFDPFLAPINNWVTISTPQILIPNTNYFLLNAIPTIYTLPALFPFGETITLASSGISTFTIAQNAGQAIIFGTNVTTVGAGGSISSLNDGNVITIGCFAINNGFIVLNEQGIWNIV